LGARSSGKDVRVAFDRAVFTGPVEPSEVGEMESDTIAITLPVEGFENVARLVASGLGSRLEYGFETIDDLQLAIELVLRSVADRGSSVTVTLVTDTRDLTIEVAPVGGLSLDDPLRALDGAGISLGTSLERLVDAVERRDEDDAVVLCKRLPAAA
jgi:hypothetical protein